MKLLRVGAPGAEKPALLAADGTYRDISGIVPDLAGAALSDESLAKVRAADWQSLPTLDKNQRIGPCVGNVGKFMCIGLNYADHAAETGAAIPKEPILFSKYPTALIGHEEAIVLPAVSQEVDFEAELVIVVGKKGRHIKEADAMSYVAGYTVGHDVSARDWQKGKPGGQWLLGKSFDTFAPIGPWITTAEEMRWPVELDIRLTINDQTMQSSNTRELIFGIDFLIAHLSCFCTLRPGDLIFTGTPSGVGVARTPQRFLKVGDRVEVSIDGLGVLSNPVVASESADARERAP